MTLAELWSIRNRGLKPSGVVFVSLLGDMPELDAIALNGDVDYRVFVGLDVCVVCSSAKLDRAFDVVSALLLQRVHGLDVWNVESRVCMSVVIDGEKLIMGVTEPCVS